MLKEIYSLTYYTKIVFFRGIGLTLIIALVWGSGVLVSADSRASGGFVFHEEKKIKPIYFTHNNFTLNLGIVAGSGDATLVKQGFNIIEKILAEWAKNIGFKVKRNPSKDEVEKIVEGIESILIERYEELKKHGVDVNVNLLLATVTYDGKPMLYVFDSRGLAQPMHENPGYALLGKGVVTGGLLLLRLLDYRPEEALTWDLGILSTFIIDMVSEVDPSVSPFLGESYFIRYEKKMIALGPLRREAYKEFKERAQKRRELIKLLWKTADMIENEEKIKEKLENLLKKNKNISK